MPRYLTLIQRNTILVDYLGKLKLAASTFQRRYNIRLDYDDLVSEATLGLIESLDRYDPNLQTDIWTFAQRHIYGRMVRSLSKHSLVNCRGHTLDTEPLSRKNIGHRNCWFNPTVVDQIEEWEKHNLCVQVCHSLTAHRDKEVGLLMLEGWSLHEISDTLSISYTKVKRASHRVIDEIRKRLVFNGNGMKEV